MRQLDCLAKLVQENCESWVSGNYRGLDSSFRASTGALMFISASEDGQQKKEFVEGDPGSDTEVLSFK